jgi:hypothetical protein
MVTRSQEAVESIVDFDEVGRLKGLIFWLAMETGTSLDFEPKFNETTSQVKERIQSNANFIGLADIMANDELAIDEARNSMHETNSEGLANLERAIRVSHLIRERREAWSTEGGEQPAQGGLAFHPLKDSIGVRCILSCDDNRVYLTRLGAGPPKQFQSNNLCFLSVVDLRENLGIS